MRKYKVALVLAHQYLSQLEPAVRDAVLANVGTILCFRVGPQDAPLLGKEFGPAFSTDDLLRLPRGHFLREAHH